ncbi:hypothetical protein N7519_005102 [Penicillium mononematosum]|uniref:uncharacterized protein n=1 Tax=Penicillium mononematosum TaxID=268346 RepID=UPI00254965D0|nr:uncharacterized protein N7519_005102 [Penicillium mononematosum]KAJ6183801.1 hypothetical protein N7519_005102 [Penicillium mononematosum]
MAGRSVVTFTTTHEPQILPAATGATGQSQFSVNSLELHLTITTEEADAGLAVAETMEQAIRKMQAEIALGDNRNAAIQQPIRALNMSQ